MILRVPTFLELVNQSLCLDQGVVFKVLKSQFYLLLQSKFLERL